MGDRDVSPRSGSASVRGVELRDEQPSAHEIGRRTFVVADVEPLDVDGVRTVGVGIVLFGVAFLALLPFYGRLAEAERTWWLWTCLAGVGLGFLGLEYCRRRREIRTTRLAQQAAEAATAVAPEPRSSPPSSSPSRRRTPSRPPSRRPTISAAHEQRPLPVDDPLGTRRPGQLRLRRRVRPDGRRR